MIKPMEPVVSKKIPKGEDWIHQIKWDGIRGLTYIQNNTYDIYTKKGNNRTSSYPELANILKVFKENNAILDGEIVFMDEGKPSFQKLLQRDRTKYKSKNAPLFYIVFDILKLNDKDLRGYPLEERQDILRTIIEKSDNITVTDSFQDGEKLYELMKTKNYEGIVSKQKTSTYTEGKKHEDWYKIKLNRKVLVVIGGIKYKNGFPYSLVVGIKKEEGFYHIGSVAIGLKESDKTLLHNYKDQLEIVESPFRNYNEKDIVWIKPILTCWIQFMEWTNDGGLRHPKMIGFSNENPEEADGRDFVL
ncbi:non-homologous end-joining DNA ligase [Natranaerovirga pectinivora]|nr:non-homologous end-joining DNA ligase [Natranaerovirga pectinivora]